jgi:molecular chaperone HtpG
MTVEAEPAAAAASPETRPFSADVAQLLRLMVHSVYSNRDVFLRELVSNAADACEKLRYAALTDAGLLGDDAAFEIVVAVDADAGTLTVSDNGIGMSRDELVDNLGTIARSGTRAFVEAIADQAAGKSESSALIGQFGVGFYSAFMVAKTVTVTSRRAGSGEAWTWSSDGSGSFTVAPAGDDAPARGTRVVLELADDAREFADEDEVERIVRAHCAHIPVPIAVLKAGADARRTLVDGSALWTKPKASVTEAEYRDFYTYVSGDPAEPALTVHFRAEGRTEYSVLAFVPSQKPFDLFDPDRRGRIKLYVRRVFITDEAPLLPAWLRFVRGVVDSEDLPLNLSREMLQSNPVLEAIRRGLTGRILTDLEKLAEKEPERFTGIWEAFGAVIKEGLYEEPDRRDGLFKIARFRTSTTPDGWRSLAEVLAGARENQTAIYYLLGDSAEGVKASPHLEGYRARGIEVLLLTDPVDAFWVQTALGYEGKPFRSVTQGAADLELIPLTGEAAADDDPARPGDVAVLVALLKERLGERVSDVRTSARLAESPVCLVAPEFGPDRQLEKLLARGRSQACTVKPVLEVNPRNILVKALAKRAAAGGAGEDVTDAAHLLYAQARILEGELPEDPADFARRLDRLIAAGVGAADA